MGRNAQRRRLHRRRRQLVYRWTCAEPDCLVTLEVASLAALPAACPGCGGFLGNIEAPDEW